MHEIAGMRGAAVIVDTCAGVKAGEEVLLVGDWWTAANGSLELLAGAISERGATPTMVLMDVREFDGNEPPASVSASMQSAEVIIAATRKSIVHSRAGERARDTSTRWISLVGLTPEELIEGGLFADYEAIRPAVHRMCDRMSSADVARVTSDVGTDVTFDLSNRTAAALDGFAHKPGSYATPGVIEAAISPVTGSTETKGTLVVDGAVPDLDIGVVEEPIYLEIEDGRVVSLTGGRAATRIRRAWRRVDRPESTNIAQLAVGMNPAVRAFSDRFRDNHGRFGNVHVGIGTSRGLLGGDVAAPIHFDGMLASATLELDGEVVLRNGDSFELGEDIEIPTGETG